MVKRRNDPRCDETGNWEGRGDNDRLFNNQAYGFYYKGWAIKDIRSNFKELLAFRGNIL